MNEISNTSFAASYVLVLIFAGFLYSRKLKLTSSIILGSLQGFIQLSLAGLVVLWLFKINDAVVLFMIVFTMCGFASCLAARRWKFYQNMGWLVTLTIYLTTMISLTFLYFIHVLSWKAQYVIPIGGMLIGQVMNNCSLFIERVTAEVTQSKTALEANLSLGATAKKVLEPVVNHTIKACSMPMVDMLKTLGIVYLPGTMAGMVIAGMDPMMAVKYQLVIVFTLTFAFGFSSILLASLIHRVLLNRHHQFRK